MNRRIGFALLLVFVLGAPAVFSQQGIAELPEPVFAVSSGQEVPLAGTSGFWLPNFEEVVYYLWNFDSMDTSGNVDFYSYASVAQGAVMDTSIPGNIRNNKYFIESVRFANLAQMALEDGDYDASTKYSMESIRYAELSDEFVRLQLKIKETDDAIAVARARLEWAASSAVDAPKRFPSEYNQAQAAYNEARSLRTAESWDQAIAAANRVINALANVTEAPPPGQPEPPPPRPTTPSEYPLPAQYTVRPWAISKDCLWNIAGRPWAYGDPNQWRLLYNANKAKMPQPDNPDLIHPGMILDIPSIRGETREGMWDAGRNYVPLR